jgi:flagellar biosynthesis protein FlhB
VADNRTERATPRRRQKAEEQGQVLRSRDLVSALTLMSAIFLLAWRPQILIGGWQTYFARVLDNAATSEWKDQLPVFTWTGLAVVQWVWPVFAVTFCVAVAATLAQGGLVVSPEALKPKWERFNPAHNVKQMFSLSTLSRVLRSLLPTAVILYLALRLILQQAAAILHSSRLLSHGALSLIGQMAFDLAWQSCLVLLVWSGADYFLQKQSHEKSLRMTKQEVKQEMKDSDGNPQVRSRIRKLRREMLRRSLDKDIKRATAVITNPTHYAVALEYRPGIMAAPVVVAKGRDFIAKKIRELARHHDVPIIENPPLARALFTGAEVGQIIPPKLYVAVAEILAFIYRTQAKAPPATVNVEGSRR